MAQVRNVLKRIADEGKLKDCSIMVSVRGTGAESGMIYGRDVTGLTRSCIEHAGGESGYEKLATLLERILEIELDGRVVFRKKKRIERIYPRA